MPYESLFRQEYEFYEWDPQRVKYLGAILNGRADIRDAIQAREGMLLCANLALGVQPPLDPVVASHRAGNSLPPNERNRYIDKNGKF